jgi:hypothetical protein
VLPLERTGDASERLETRVTFRTGQMVHTFAFVPREVWMSGESEFRAGRTPTLGRPPARPRGRDGDLAANFGISRKTGYKICDR